MPELSVAMKPGAKDLWRKWHLWRDSFDGYRKKRKNILRGEGSEAETGSSVAGVFWGADRKASQ